eukprot:c44849_g1_i1 orf=46-288(-)
MGYNNHVEIDKKAPKTSLQQGKVILNNQFCFTFYEYVIGLLYKFEVPLENLSGFRRVIKAIILPFLDIPLIVHLPFHAIF